MPFSVQNRYFRTFPALFLFVLTLTCFSKVSAQTNSDQNEADYRQSIGDIGKKIKAITRNLNANKALLKNERDELFKTEQSITNLNKKIEDTQYRLAKTEHELDALVLRINKLDKDQKANKAALARLISVRYKNGKKDYLQSVLNQENPYAVGRLNNYHNYFSGALKTKYDVLTRLATETLELKQQQSSIIAKLKADKESNEALKLKQEKSKILRAATISKLDKKVSSSTSELDQLVKDRERLQSLLTQLKKQAAELKRIERQREKERARQLAEQNKPAPPPTRLLVKGGFLKQKGRLQYPVSVAVKRKFGSRLPESGMRAEGHFFATNGSVSVKSIFRGRVLFADFLKGYGQLIIIDHGDDHISLYGHNDKLLKKVGDAVETNEVIAKSGVTGGLKSPGLYFEIRNNASPVDPSKWCQ